MCSDALNNYTLTLKMAYGYHKHWEQHILQILLHFIKILTLPCNALNTSGKSSEFNRMDLLVKFEEIVSYGLFYDAARLYGIAPNNRVTGE
jgi:hypothetical protein